MRSKYARTAMRTANKMPMPKKKTSYQSFFKHKSFHLTIFKLKSKLITECVNAPDEM
jgi:hypothetical protein